MMGLNIYHGNSMLCFINLSESLHQTHNSSLVCVRLIDLHLNKWFSGSSEFNSQICTQSYFTANGIVMRKRFNYANVSFPASVRFHPSQRFQVLSATVYFSVCKQHSWKSHGWNLIKFSGNVPFNNRFNFVDDPDHQWDLGFFFVCFFTSTKQRLNAVCPLNWTHTHHLN